jgi:uncharacterized protein YdeI (YjbR/CyaY-like superfamily)
MKPVFFTRQSQFRKWMEKNHDKESELWVGFYKKDSGKDSITWPQSVDEALCFGWIDGIRKSIDSISYMIRFTPRKSTSIWSSINIKRANELSELGLMDPAGIAVFKNRDEKKSNQYSFEQKSVKLDEEFEKKFRANKKAWNHFQSMAPSYKKTATWWVMSAKQEETRLRRLNILIKDSGMSQKIGPLKRAGE